MLQLGGAVADVADEATAYTGKGANYYWLAEPVWDDAADDDRCLAWGRITGKSLSTFSMAGNYVNEQADAGTVVALDAYGPGEVPAACAPKDAARSAQYVPSQSEHHAADLTSCLNRGCASFPTDRQGGLAKQKQVGGRSTERLFRVRSHASRYRGGRSRCPNRPYRATRRRASAPRRPSCPWQ